MVATITCSELRFIVTKPSTYNQAASGREQAQRQARTKPAATTTRYMALAFTPAFPALAPQMTATNAGSQPAARPKSFDARGPYCPLLSVEILRHCVAAKKQRAGRSSKHFDVDVIVKLANAYIHSRQGGQAEWLYLRSLSPDSLFRLALLVQRRDVTLAREAFRLGVQALGDGDAVEAKRAQMLLSWGLFESKQQGRIGCARSLLRRSVLLDPGLSPVLKWKAVFD
jgi:hypothetical protein